MPLKDLPLQRKLLSFIFVITLSVLAVSYLVLLAYETHNSKLTTTRNLTVIGGIIASNSTASLLYDDSKLAREILLGLRAEPDITSAALFDRDGKLRATYPSGLDPRAISSGLKPDGVYFNFHELTIYHPVVEGETRMGTLFLKSDLASMYRRLAVYGLILLVVLAGSAVLAFFLSNFFQRQITEPILALANVAKQVAQKKDYSVRAQKLSGPELGFLTDAFNSMLEEIQLNLAAISESDQRFRLVADSAPVLIWLSDKNEQAIWFNKHWLEFVGQSLEHELGLGWMENIHPEDRQRCKAKFAEAFAAREEFRMEYRLRCGNGAFRWVFDHGVPRNQGKEFAGFIGSCVDIHDRKEAEAAARSSELQIRLVTDHASVFLAQLDLEQRYKFVNRAYAERYGRKPQDLIGRHISEVVGMEVYKLSKERIESTLSGRREDFELELPYADLGPRWVHLVCVPEREPDGRVVGLVAVLTDNTQRRQAERELERARDEAVAASRAKDDFLAALSHELRTPLSPVLLLASEAAMNLNLPAETRREFEIIRKNVELEARLIDDLLDLTSITRGKLSLERRVIDAHAVLRDALGTVRADIEAKHLTLTTTLAAQNATVFGDAVRLQQVFWNVFKNAVKFTPDGGKITLHSRNPTGQDVFAFSITDTGIGMIPEEMSRIFEAFAQGDHANTGGLHRFGGLGLGLAISRKVIELHGGRITVASDGRNCGCTFSIEVPLASAGNEAPMGQSAPPRSFSGSASGEAGGNGTVLLVEDHAPTRAAVEQLLRRRNYRVITAGSIAQARGAAEHEAIGLVISDIGLPDGTGYELMAFLKQRYGLKGIALTGYGMEDDISQSQDAGFIVHLTKPVRVESLTEALLKKELWLKPVN